MGRAKSILLKYNGMKLKLLNEIASSYVPVPLEREELPYGMTTIRKRGHGASPDLPNAEAADRILQFLRNLEPEFDVEIYGEDGAGDCQIKITHPDINALHQLERQWSRIMLTIRNRYKILLHSSFHVFI